MSRPVDRIASELDPMIEAYKKDIDRTLLREDLRLTPDERARALMELLEAAEEFRRGGLGEPRVPARVLGEGGGRARAPRGEPERRRSAGRGAAGRGDRLPLDAVCAHDPSIVTDFGAICMRKGKPAREAGYDDATFPGAELCHNGDGGPACLTRPFLRG